MSAVLLRAIGGLLVLDDRRLKSVAAVIEELLKQQFSDSKGKRS